MAKNVFDIDHGFSDIRKELKKLDKLCVKVGIIEGSGENGGVSIAEYAAYNEQGTKNIPSRPFIRSWVDNNESKISSFMDSVYNRVATGKISAEKAMALIGQFGESGIKENIREGDFKANAASTVKQKGSSAPLIDTGTMRNSIRYEVVKR